MSAAPIPLESSRLALREGYSSPIRTGWITFLRSLPSLAIRTLPLAAALGLASRFVEQDANGGITGGWTVVAAMVGILVYAVALIQVLITWSHTGVRHGNPYTFALRHLPGWLATGVLMLTAAFAGYIALLIPGVYLSVRLFWADEYALHHGLSPLEALKATWKLTKGQAWTVFVFQFLTGAAGLVVVFVGLLLTVPVASWIERVPAIGQAAGNACLYWVVMLTYAGVHAPEIAYFYGLRARKKPATLPRGGASEPA